MTPSIQLSVFVFPNEFEVTLRLPKRGGMGGEGEGGRCEREGEREAEERGKKGEGEEEGGRKGERRKSGKQYSIIRGRGKSSP